MEWSEHYEKDIAFHAATAAEYDDLIVKPREVINDLLFQPFHAMIPDGARMLDLGTGTGHAALRFGERFEAVVGVDHSQAMLQLADRKLREAGLRHVVLFEQDMQTFLDSAVSRFDFVTAVGCLHHLPAETIPGVLHSAFETLKPGGRLLVAEPIEVDLSQQPGEIAAWNARSVAAGRDFSTEVEEADEAPISREELAGTLAGIGFEPVLDQRAWELFPAELPPSRNDLETIRDLHRRFGPTGNVLVTLQRKPR